MISWGWPLTIDHWPLTIDHWPLTIDHWPLIIDNHIQYLLCFMENWFITLSVSVSQQIFCQDQGVKLLSWLEVFDQLLFCTFENFTHLRIYSSAAAVKRSDLIILMGQWGLWCRRDKCSKWRDIMAGTWTKSSSSLQQQQRWWNISTARH